MSEHKRAGRPAWIPPDSATVEELAAHGMSDQEIAFSLGINPSTLCRKKREFEQFAQAIKAGRAKGIQKATCKLFELAMAGNPACLIFFLKARAGWRDIGDGPLVNVNVGGGPPSAVEDAERLEQLEAIRALSFEERQQYLDLLRRARARVAAKRRGQPAPAIGATPAVFTQQIEIDPGDPDLEELD